MWPGGPSPRQACARWRLLQFAQTAAVLPQSKEALRRSLEIWAHGREKERERRGRLKKLFFFFFFLPLSSARVTEVTSSPLIFWDGRKAQSVWECTTLVGQSDWMRGAFCPPLAHLMPNMMSRRLPVHRGEGFVTWPFFSLSLFFYRKVEEKWRGNLRMPFAAPAANRRRRCRPSMTLFFSS